MALARAACQRFNLPESSLDDLVQAMGDTLVAGCKAVALRCKYCNTWHMDTGKFAVTPHRVHLCQACGARFQSPMPTIGHPFSMLQPQLHGTTMTLLQKSLPDVQAAFEGMDHLAEESDIQTEEAAT